MNKVNLFEVKAKLSEYVDRAMRGEHIVICRHNRPVAELRAIDETREQPRPIGPLPGRPTFEVPPSFFEPLPDDELDLWDTGPIAAEPARPKSVRRSPRVAEQQGSYGRGRAAARRRTRR
jgi:prevent-host-death family protein